MCEEGTASVYVHTCAGVCTKGTALSDRFAAPLMTRNHGTVMSLSYDAPCPGGEDAQGRKRESVRYEDERSKRCTRRRKNEELFSYVTPTGITAASSFSSHLVLSGGLTSLLEIQIPREPVVMLCTMLCALSLSLSLSFVSLSHLYRLQCI